MKEHLRSSILQIRENYEDGLKSSNRIIDTILNSEFITENNTFLFYYPVKNEVNLLPLLKILKNKGKKVFLPKTDGENIYPVEVSSLEDLQEGKFGILEPIGNPVNKQLIDVVFVPAIAFDKSGNRLGYGKGFYDRFLVDFKGLKVGVAYDFQIVDEIPADSHDVPVDIIITPTKKLTIKEEMKDG